MSKMPPELVDSFAQGAQSALDLVVHRLFLATTATIGPSAAGPACGVLDTGLTCDKPLRRSTAGCEGTQLRTRHSGGMHIVIVIESKQVAESMRCQHSDLRRQ
jgi:hypothetical protein